MMKTLCRGCVLVAALLVFSRYGECASTSTNIPTTTPNAGQTSSDGTTTPVVTTEGNKPTTTTESMLDLIARLVQKGISDGMAKLLDAISPSINDVSKTHISFDITTQSQTTQPPQTTTPASAETTPSSQTTSSSNSGAAKQSSGTTGTSSSTTVATMAEAVCPQGLYDDQRNAVTFVLEDRECQITVYLSKPPKARKESKEKRGGKGKREHGRKRGKDGHKHGGQSEKSAERFIEKNISVGPTPGREIDRCPEVITRKYKEHYYMYTNECVLFRINKTRYFRKGQTIPVQCPYRRQRGGGGEATGLHQ